MPDIHAKQFSPSSAYKWLNCPGSAALEAMFPDTASEHAKEGTLAHAIGELKLQKQFTAMSKQSFSAKMNRLKKDGLYQEEMQGYTDEYVEYITETAMRFKAQPFVAIEKQVSFEKYASGGFGTSDCIIIGENVMYIVDFKYGKGVPVSAERNPQGMLYALGALEEYRLFYDIHKVVIAIVQPRLSNISEFEISKDELIQWGEDVVKPAAARITAGETECKAGAWCDKGFCRARGRCRAQSAYHTALEDFKFALPPLLTDEEVGSVLVRAEGLKKWVSELEEYALKAILEGREIQGWKAVEGRKVRAFTDIDKAFEHLQKNGIQQELLYERKPLSLTNVEKMIGKKDFAELTKDFVTVQPGKPTLVAESDKREAYRVKNAASDFSEIVNQ